VCVLHSTRRTLTPRQGFSPGPTLSGWVRGILPGIAVTQARRRGPELRPVHHVFTQARHPAGRDLLSTPSQGGARPGPSHRYSSAPPLREPGLPTPGPVPVGFRVSKVTLLPTGLAASRPQPDSEDSDTAEPSQPPQRHCCRATVLPLRPIVDVPGRHQSAGRGERVGAATTRTYLRYARARRLYRPASLTSQRAKVPLFGHARRLHIEPSLFACERHDDADCRPEAGLVRFYPRWQRIQHTRAGEVTRHPLLCYGLTRPGGPQWTPIRPGTYPKAQILLSSMAKTKN
jgi:hypothetical protein